MNVYNAVYETNTAFVQAMLILAKTYLYIGNYEEALDWCHSLIESCPSCVDTAAVLESIQSNCANQKIAEQANQLLRGIDYGSEIKR